MRNCDCGKDKFNFIGHASWCGAFMTYEQMSLAAARMEAAHTALEAKAYLTHSDRGERVPASPPVAKEAKPKLKTLSEVCTGHKFPIKVRYVGRNDYAGLQHGAVYLVKRLIDLAGNGTGEREDLPSGFDWFLPYDAGWELAAPKPRTLADIYEEVGKFPFKVRKLDVQDIGDSISPGAVVTIHERWFATSKTAPLNRKYLNQSWCGWELVP